MSPKIVEDLAPTGVLRAAINLSNFLMVTGRNDEGKPAGVSPDMAQEVARRLGVERHLRFILWRVWRACDKPRRALRA